MKIAFDAKRFFHNSSGLGNYSRDLVRILATYFPENSYLLLNKDQYGRGKEILNLPGVSFIEISRSFLSRQINMGKEAQDAGAELFHGLSGELPMKWNDRPIKKVVTIHDLIFMRYPKYYSWLDRKIYFWKFKKAAESADLIIAISEQTKRDIIHYLKISADKITVVYQGCHAAFRNETDKSAEKKLRDTYALPERFILSVGTIESRKNLLNTVKSIHGTDIPLVVVGRKTNFYKKVFGYIKKHKMQGQVQFLEGLTMDELAGLYKIADVLVYPSFFEGFGIPVIEALFSGTPVITSNTSSLPEAGGPDSMYVDPANTDDLRSKIFFLWSNEAERTRRAEKGKVYVQKFSDERVAGDVMKAYRSIL
ncbi:MAG: glycosyltransferase family 4 protein [Weeksellaceae bacterium]|nr:glycosyltransferase family 4 protein [Weeksellaceae bacterium]